MSVPSTVLSSALLPERSLDTPTPAMSRAFFREQETLMAQQTTNVLLDTSLQQPVNRFRYKFSSEVLESICIYLVSVDSIATIDWSKLPVDIERVTADLKAASGSIYAVISSKLRECYEVLRKYTAGDGRTTRRASIDDDPTLWLIDCLLDTLGVVKSTTGIWDLQREEQQALALLADEVSVAVTEFQRRMLFHLKARHKRLAVDKTGSDLMSASSETGTPQPVPSTDLVEALGRFTLCVTTALRENLVNSSSLLRDSNRLEDIRNPAATALILSDQGSSPDSSKPNCSQLPPAYTLPSPSAESILAFVHTVAALDSSPLLQQLFRLPELDLALTALKGIRAGLEELGRKQRFSWASLADQKMLPRTSAILLSSEGASFAESSCDISATTTSSVSKEASHDIASTNAQASSDDLQYLLRTQLEDFSRHLMGFYRLVGTVLGAGYDDLVIQQELTAISVLGAYISLVGFLFYRDIETLAHWLVPYLPNVRRRLKKSGEGASPKPNGTLNGAQSNGGAPKEPNGAAFCSLSAPTKVSTSATALTEILSNPAELSLTRQVEGEALLHLFLPHYTAGKTTQATGRGGFVTAPATRINRFLVWLAWEGDLVQLYCDKTSSFGGDVHSNANEKLPSDHVEAAIERAILRGLGVVVEKLSPALPLFFDQPQSPTSRNGMSVAQEDNVIEFCHRMLESLTLCHLGEIDLKATREIFLASVSNERLAHTTRLRQPLAMHLGKRSLLQKPTQVSTKITEGLPKLVGNFLHQSLFYAAPISHSRRHPGHLFEASTSNVIASTVRISGLLAHVDRRVTSSRRIGEMALLNSQANHAALSAIQQRLAEIEATTPLSKVSRRSDETSCLTGGLPKLSASERCCGTTPARNGALSPYNNAGETMNDENTDPQRGATSTSLPIPTGVDGPKDSQTGGSTGLEDQFSKPFAQLQYKIQQIEQGMQHQLQLLNEVKAKEGWNGPPELEKRIEKLSSETQLNASNLSDINKEIHKLRASVDELQTSFVNSVLERTKKELSAYLTQTLSQSIHNHIVYALEQQQQKLPQQQRRRPRLLPWTSPRKSWGPDATGQTNSNPGATADPPQIDLDPNQPATCQQHPLIQSTHRRSSSGKMLNGTDTACDSKECLLPMPCEGTTLQGHPIWRGFDGDADTVSVMQELEANNAAGNGSERTWFDAGTQLLDMPDPAVNDDIPSAGDDHAGNPFTQPTDTILPESYTQPFTCKQSTSS